jgi:hypothetical protein
MERGNELTSLVGLRPIVLPDEGDKMSQIRDRAATFPPGRGPIYLQGKREVCLASLGAAPKDAL